MNEKLHLTARIWREGDDYVAWCPELDVSSFGDDYDDALAKLHEAVVGYIAEVGYAEAAAEAHPEAATFPLEISIGGNAA